MNLFNCYQFMGFYTISPLGIYWLFENGHNIPGYICGVVLFIFYNLVCLGVYGVFSE